LAIKATTVRIELAVRKQAEEMLEEIGMDLNTYLTASVKALVRERKVPFEMATAQYIADQATYKKPAETGGRALTFAYPAQTEHVQDTADDAVPEEPIQSQREAAYPTLMVTKQQYTTDHATLEKLAQAEIEAADPDTELLRHEDVFYKIRERHAYEI